MLSNPLVSELETLNVPQTKPPDFDRFWAETRYRCASVPLNVCGDNAAEVRDLTFDGLDGTPVHTWLILPPEAKRQKVPAVIHCHGANRSRGKPADFSVWTAAGCAVISPDYRLQRGITGSKTLFDGDGTSCRWTLNLNDLMNSYLYCTWTDFLRAVRLARETPEIDPRRIAVTGHSQGGGMALGLAALDPSAALCMADVPSSCWMERRILSRSGGGAGIADYLAAFPERAETVRRNLSYFDNINLAPQIGCPVLVSCGLRDMICPPECTYAACNKIGTEKEMVIYPQAGHEGGGAAHLARKVEFLRRHFLIKTEK
ncbi:MAG: acetylxylan esterase [Pontiellaceae bacterium]|jgi:cephalosporin-C deacetylase|nr:acetylxylan esterase [Pontiellaceae bacterium]